MTMIERVARAICEAEKMNPDDALGGWVHWKEAAQAAVEAMREPTEAMTLAPPDVNFSPGDAAHTWKCMIDAALAE